MPPLSRILLPISGAAAGIGGAEAFNHLSGQGRNMTSGDHMLQALLAGGFGGLVGSSRGRRALFNLASKERIIDGTVQRTISPLQVGTLAGAAGSAVVAPTWVPSLYRAASPVVDGIVSPPPGQEDKTLAKRLLDASKVAEVPAATLDRIGMVDKTVDAATDMAGNTAKSYLKTTGLGLRDLAAPTAAAVMGGVGALAGDKLALRLYPELSRKKGFKAIQAQDRKRALAEALLTTVVGSGAAFGGYHVMNELTKKAATNPTLLKALRTLLAGSAAAGTSRIWQEYGDSSKLNAKTKLQRDMQAFLVGSLASSGRIRRAIAPHINKDTIINGGRVALADLPKTPLWQHAGRGALGASLGAGTGYVGQDVAALMRGELADDHSKGLGYGALVGGVGGLLSGGSAAAIRARRLAPYLALPGATYFGRGAVGALSGYPKLTMGDRAHDLEAKFNSGKSLDDVVHSATQPLRDTVAKKTESLANDVVDKMRDPATAKELSDGLVKANPNFIRDTLRQQAIAAGAGIAGSVGGWSLGGLMYADDDSLSDDERLERRDKQTMAKMTLSTLLGTGAAIGAAHLNK